MGQFCSKKNLDRKPLPSEDLQKFFALLYLRSHPFCRRKQLGSDHLDTAASTLGLRCLLLQLGQLQGLSSCAGSAWTSGKPRLAPSMQRLQLPSWAWGRCCWSSSSRGQRQSCCWRRLSTRHVSNWASSTARHGRHRNSWGAASRQHCYVSSALTPCAC